MRPSLLLRIAGVLVLTSRGEPALAEEVTDAECDAFHPDDDLRICGLDMHFEQANMPFWVRTLLETEAKYYALSTSLE